MEENIIKYRNAIGSGKQAITQGQKRKGGRGMREGWEYKKLGDSCVIEYGTRVVQKKDGGTIYPVYGGGGETFRMDKYNRENCLVVARFAMSRTCVRYVTGKFFLNDSGLSINAGKELLQSYLNHHILHLNDDIYNLGKGAAQRNLDVNSFRNLIITIPPLSTQQSIVSELDKINELIRLKKEQLKDYDNLAQSIFYEMFGDPVVNEKGWEVDYLSHLCNVFAGGDKPSDLSEMQSKEFPYPVIANGDGDKGILGYSKMCKIKEDAVTIGARGASIGNCRLVRNGFTPAIRLITLVPQMKLDCNYLYYYVRNMNYRVNGVAQAQLTVPNVQRELIPIPPLPLQQLFAQRIELIEKQKAEIQRTISDLETLLASRMQYWFD